MLVTSYFTAFLGALFRNMMRIARSSLVFALAGRNAGIKS